MTNSNVLAFPPKMVCPSCQRPCSEDDLSECTTCGGLYCGRASNQCPSQCSCDRLAIDLAERAAIFVEGAKRRQTIAQNRTRSRSRRRRRTQRGKVSL